TAPARVLSGRRPRAAGRIRSRAFGAMAEGRAAAAAAPRRTLALGAEAGGSAAGPARRGAAPRAPTPRDAGRGPGRRARRLDLGAGAPWAAGDRDRQRSAAPAPVRLRTGRAPARRRLPLAAAAAAGLDGLRHGGAALARGPAHGPMAARGLVPAHDLQPQAADEEALAGDAAQPGDVRGASRDPAGGARAPALPRPRGDHGPGEPAGHRLNGGRPGHHA